METVSLLNHKSCEQYIWKWESYFGHMPDTLALVKITNEKNYWDFVGPKTRNMIRKAIKLEYNVHPFEYNGYLDQMFVINTSIPSRQGQRMTPEYFRQLAPLPYQHNPCVNHEQIYVGVFDKKETLAAYCWLAICGEIAVINRILGHAYCLRDGVMNLMIAGLVRQCENRGVKWLNYRTMESTTEGLKAFKKHVGFRPVKVEITR